MEGTERPVEDCSSLASRKFSEKQPLGRLPGSSWAWTAGEEVGTQLSTPLASGSRARSRKHGRCLAVPRGNACPS